MTWAVMTKRWGRNAILLPRGAVGAPVAAALGTHPAAASTFTIRNL